MLKGLEQSQNVHIVTIAKNKLKICFFLKGVQHKFNWDHMFPAPRLLSLHRNPFFLENKTMAEIQNRLLLKNWNSEMSPESAVS